MSGPRDKLYSKIAELGKAYADSLGVDESMKRERGLRSVQTGRTYQRCLLDPSI